MQKQLAKIKKLPFVGDVRNCGMMAGIEIVKDKQTKTSFDFSLKIGAKLCYAMRKKHVMLRPLGDCIVIMPPVAIGTDLLGELLDVVADSIENDLPQIIEGT